MSRWGTGWPAAAWGVAGALALVAACSPPPPAQEPSGAQTPDTHTAQAQGTELGPPAAQTPRTTPPGPAVPPPAALPVSAAAVAMPMFTSSVGEITPELAERMAASWRPGCPVPLADLRYLTVSHVTFDGGVAVGELVVHADVADGLVDVFATLFAQRFPIRSMRLVDDFGADDTASMDGDNTSAFNCRAVTGGTGWSEHAYGRAIDLNPIENPYVLGRHVAPAAGRAYADRPDLPGVVHDGDVVVAAFAAAGWRWGGHWDSPVDYQHFSVSGR